MKTINRQVPTLERLHQLFYIDEHWQLRWRVSTNGRVKPGEIAGTVKKGYLWVQIDGRRYFVHRLIYYLHHGYYPENQLDHIDRNPLNNDPANLREVGQQCNSRNCGLPSTNTSGVKGVCWNKRDGKWRSQVKVDGKVINLGNFDHFPLAAFARWRAEVDHQFPSCCCDSSAWRYLLETPVSTLFPLESRR